MGQTAHRANISGVSSATKCEITTDAAHGYSTNDFIRITDLNGMMPVKRGVDQINNRKYKIVVTDTDKFTLKNPITFKDVDSTNFTPYVSGGYCNLVETIFEYLA